MTVKKTKNEGLEGRTQFVCIKFRFIVYLERREVTQLRTKKKKKEKMNDDEILPRNK